MMGALKEFWEDQRLEQEEIDLELYEHDKYFAKKRERKACGIPMPVPSSLKPEKKSQV